MNTLRYLSLPDLEAFYDLLADAIDLVPPEKTELMLTKLALLMANEVADIEKLKVLLESARQDL